MCIHGSPLAPLPPSVPHWVISVLGQIAGSHLPDLAGAREVRKEVALCPVGIPNWIPITKEAPGVLEG